MNNMFRVIPFTFIILAICNIMLFIDIPEGGSIKNVFAADSSASDSSASDSLATVILKTKNPTVTQDLFQLKLFSFSLPSGSKIIFNIGYFLIIVGLIALYFEIIKSTTTSNVAIVDHTFSVVVFLIYLFEFIFVKKLGNLPFLVLAFIAFIDVIAGFTITISAARRDINEVIDR